MMFLSLDQINKGSCARTQRVCGEVCMDSSHYSPLPCYLLRRKAVALNASKRCRNINLHFVTVVLSILFSPQSSVTNKKCFWFCFSG